MFGGLTCINFNPNMGKKNYIHHEMLNYKIIHSFPNFNGAAVEVCEWMSNFVPLFTLHVITYSYRY